MPKVRKTGEQISWREFFKRWKSGIQGITQLQMLQHQMRGMRIIMLGLFFGIVVCFFNIKVLWWLLIILIGGFYVNLMQFIGLWQKKITLENLYKGVEENEQKSTSG